MCFLHLIADYGNGDPAFNEVIHRLRQLDQDIEVATTSVPSFSTIATGFWIAQYGLYNPSFESLGIYANTAPRKEDIEEMEENEGEELVYARLDNGVPVIAVNAGYSLSFVRDRIDELHATKVPQKGSQFRSRDFFPRAVVSILHGSEEHIGEELDPATIPSPPEDRIAHIDGYGNIKTTTRKGDTDLEAGEEVMITINSESRRARYEEHTFEVREGDLSFAPGSAGGGDPFLELFLRGGSAAAAFDQPSAGQQIDWDRSVR